MQANYRYTRIVCTLGPATSSAEMIRGLIEAGMDVARVNFSHGTHEDHAESIRLVREISGDMNKPVAILQDLQGPKIRVGLLPDGPIELVAGQVCALVPEEDRSRGEEIPTTYGTLAADVRPGDSILLDDGEMVLRAVACEQGRVEAEIVRGGLLREHKGINLPRVKISAPSLTEKDKRDLEFGLDHGVDYVAMSFVRRPQDVGQLRDMIRCRGAEALIIAKIEKPEAIDTIDGILEIADGVMVARGDLGVEMEPERVPILQKRIIEKANYQGVLVITATQMLESMISSATPTRAETSDVANAIFDGTDCVMLSAETSIGAFPLEAVRMMDRIAHEAERSIRERGQFRDRRIPSFGFSNPIARASALLARDTNAAAIATFSLSGGTARLVSKYRPPCPVISVSADPGVARRLSMCWGILPLVVAPVRDTDEMVNRVEATLTESGLVREGDVIVFTASVPVARRGASNAVMLHRVGRQEQGLSSPKAE